MNRFAIFLIKQYQRFSSGGPKHCRYHPSCSNYAMEAYKKHNFFYASYLTAYRILRCNPFSKGGYDPVPKTYMEKLFDKEFGKKTK